MATIAVPYHLDERLADFAPGVPETTTVTADLPPEGGPWERMAVLYEHVAAAVAAQAEPPLVATGDCATSLGVLAGLRRAGHDPGIVWLDAHGDFHTARTTESGYLGGMPLAIAAGVGESPLPPALGTPTVEGARIVLADARDTEPAEDELLAAAGVRRLAVPEIAAGTLPAGPLYLHVDVDVLDPEAMPGLLYPAPGGPTVRDVVDAVGRVMATGRVAAATLAATWHPGAEGAAVRRGVVERLAAVLPA